MSNDKIQMNVFVVIPTYNESKTIGFIVNGLRRQNFRVVVVDDGSIDHTIVEGNRFGADIIVHSNNIGKGRCIREGLEYAMENGCDIVITMDGDGQHDIKEIPLFIEEYERNQPDIVIGNRMHSPHKMPFIRRCTNMLMSFIISIMLKERIDDTQCGYRLISRRALERMSLNSTKYEIESEMLVEAKRHNLFITAIQISSIYRDEISQINPFWDTVRFIKFIVYETFRRRD